jgi:hypothetical protein
MLRKIFQSVGVMLAIFSAFWIIVGSTIMFHQVHVYHNHVDIWQIQAINIHGKDLKKVFQFVDNIQRNHINLAFLNQNYVNEYGLVALHLNERTIYSRYLYDLISPEYIYDKSLRGPPNA